MLTSGTAGAVLNIQAIPRMALVRLSEPTPAVSKSLTYDYLWASETQVEHAEYRQTPRFASEKLTSGTAGAVHRMYAVLRRRW